MKEGNGWTALMFAARGGHIETVQVLLRKGADPNIKNNKNYGSWTALMFAAAGGKTEIVQTLIGVGADPNAKDANNDKTPLIEAAIGGHTETVQILLDNGADMTAKDKIDMTAFMWAANTGNMSVVKALIKRGADLNSNHGPSTALMFAAARGRATTVKALIDIGADPNLKDPYFGWTALMHAADGGHSETVRVLIENGGDLNIKDKNGKTALMWAVKERHHDVVQLLNSHDLVFAAKNGHPDIVKTLIDDGSNPNRKNELGWTPLMIAAAEGHTETVKVLIDRGADPNIQDKLGWTPLMWAASNGHDQAVKTLLGGGADAKLKNKKGMTAENIYIGNKVSIQGLQLDIFKRIFNGNFDELIKYNQVDAFDQVLMDRTEYDGDYYNFLHIGINQAIVDYVIRSSTICKAKTINGTIKTTDSGVWVTKDGYGNILKEEPYVHIMYIDEAVAPLYENATKWTKRMGLMIPMKMFDKKFLQRSSLPSLMSKRMKAIKSDLKTLFRKWPCQSVGIRKFQRNLIRFYEMQLIAQS